MLNGGLIVCEWCCLTQRLPSVNSRIQEVVVHEAITRWQVKYYLAIVLKPAVTLQSTRIAQPRGREASDEGDARLLSSLKQSTTLNDSRLQASTTISPKVTDASEGSDALEHAHSLKPQSSMPAVPTTTLNGGKRRRHIQHRYQPTMAVVFDNLRPRLDLLLTVRDGLAAMLPE